MRKMSDAEVIGFLKGCGPINLSEAIRRMGPGCSGWCRVVKLAAKAGFDRDAWKKDKRDKIVKYLTAFPDQPQGRIADILGYSRPMVCSIGIAQGIRRKNSKSGVAHPERDATIIAELNKGLSFQKAAVLFSLSKAVVKRIAKRYGIVRRPGCPKGSGRRTLTPQKEFNVFMALHDPTQTYAAIARNNEVSEISVFNIAKKNGIQRGKGYHAHRLNHLEDQGRQAPMATNSTPEAHGDDRQDQAPAGDIGNRQLAKASGFTSDAPVQVCRNTSFASTAS